MDGCISSVLMVLTYGYKVLILIGQLSRNLIDRLYRLTRKNISCVKGCQDE